MGFSLNSILSFFNAKDDVEPITDTIVSTNCVYTIGELDQTFFGKDYRAEDLAIIIDKNKALLDTANSFSISEGYRAKLQADMDFAHQQYALIEKKEYQPKNDHLADDCTL